MNSKYSFTAEESAARLDKFVAVKCAELSRTHAQELISQGHITVNDQPARAGPAILASVPIPDKMPTIVPKDNLPKYSLMMAPRNG